MPVHNDRDVRPPQGGIDPTSERRVPVADAWLVATRPDRDRLSAPRVKDDARAGRKLPQRRSIPVDVMPAAARKRIDIRQSVQERPRADGVADLSCDDEKSEWEALVAADGVQLCPTRDIVSQSPVGQWFMPLLLRSIR